MSFHHYTPAYRAAMILRSGVLTPFTIGLRDGDTAYCWFSTNPDMDRTATTSGPMTRTILGDHRTRHMRFTYLGNDLIPYSKLRIRFSHRKKLEDRAKNVNSLPFQWYGTDREIPLSSLSLEDSINGVWKPIDPESLLTEFDGFNLKLLGNQILIGKAA